MTPLWSYVWTWLVSYSDVTRAAAAAAKWIISAASVRIERLKALRDRVLRNGVVCVGWILKFLIIRHVDNVFLNYFVEFYFVKPSYLTIVDIYISIPEDISNDPFEFLKEEFFFYVVSLPVIFRFECFSDELCIYFWLLKWVAIMPPGI